MYKLRLKKSCFAAAPHISYINSFLGVMGALIILFVVTSCQDTDRGISTVKISKGYMAGLPNGTDYNRHEQRIADSIMRFSELTFTAPQQADSVLALKLELPEVQSDSLFYYSALHSRAVARLYMYDFDTCDSLSRRVRAYCDRNPSSSHFYHRLNYDNLSVTALMYRYSGRLPQSYERFCDAEAYAYRHRLTDVYYNVAINVCDLLLSQRRYPEAAAHLRRGLFLCDSLQLPLFSKVPFYNSLSIIYIALGDYKTAIRYSDDAQPMLEGAAPIDVCSFWNTRGQIYYFNRQYAEAKPAFEEALRVARQTSMHIYHYYTELVNLQDVNIRLQKFDSVTVELEDCKKFFQEYQFIPALHYVATLQALQALTENQDLKAAGDYLASSPDGVNDESLLSIRREVLKEYYTRLSLKDSIIKVEEEIIAAKDSLLNNVAAMRIADVELHYKESMREIELRNRQAQIELRSYIIVAILVVLVLAVMLTIFGWRNYRKKRDMERVQLTSWLTQEKVRSMRRRLSPHYLMNLIRLVKNNANDEAKIEGIAMTLRSSLEISDKIAIPLNEEIRFVKDFISILPQVGDITIRWNIAPEVDGDAWLIPGMSIQLPLENAVKYAFAEDFDTAESKCIDIVAEVQTRGAIKGMVLAVQDNGVGLKNEAFSTTSNGYKIITKTISCLNMRNKNSIDMTIRDRANIGEGHGLKVEFFFPLDFKYEF